MTTQRLRGSDTPSGVGTIRSSLPRPATEIASGSIPLRTSRSRSAAAAAQRQRLAAKVPRLISTSIEPRNGRVEFERVQGDLAIGASRKYCVVDESDTDRALRTCLDDVLDDQFIPNTRGPALTRPQDCRLPGNLLDLGNCSLFRSQDVHRRNQQCSSEPICSTQYCSPGLITTFLIHQDGRVSAAR